MVIQQLTVQLADGRSVQVSCQICGAELRFRAQVVSADRIIADTLQRRYDANDPEAAVDFNRQCERLVGPAWPSRAGLVVAIDSPGGSRITGVHRLQ